MNDARSKVDAKVSDEAVDEEGSVRRMADEGAAETKHRS